MNSYFPVLVQASVAIGFCCSMLIMSVLLGKRGNKNAVKDTPYECGMIAQGDGAPRFSVKFYIVAMLFVLFDIEVVFMYPWATNFRELVAQSPAAFYSIASFAGILAIAYVYALKKGAFSWNTKG
jgi:NADH-quinone oxidoreductase subunit A